MSEQYLHLLIAEDSDFTPTGEQIVEFLKATVDEGFLPPTAELRFSSPTGETRSVPNPFTAEVMTREIWSSQQLRSLDEIVDKTAGQQEYRVLASAATTPVQHAVPVSFDDEYHIGFKFNVHPSLRCTSSVAEASNLANALTKYGQKCDASQFDGWFNHPETGERIEVPSAGCAKFWIEIEMGKWLFPKIENNNLAIVHPQLMQAAERVFGQRFAQGCSTL